MKENNWQKIKLWKLVELLSKETDEDHPLTTSQICNRMKEMNIPCDRRTLAEDVKLLNDHGLDIQRRRVSKAMGYFIGAREFELAELKILVDAVQGSSFINPSLTEKLTNKLTGLVSTHQADFLRETAVYANSRKHANVQVYYIVDEIVNALHQGKKLTFQYFDLDGEGNPVWRHDGGYYEVDPLALVFNEDNYYMVGYSIKHEGLTHYRVDRMHDAHALSTEISEEAKQCRSEVSERVNQSVKMYSGESVELTLVYSKELLGAVYDRFGENTKMQPVDEDRYTAQVTAQLSPPFWGWLFQFGKGMRITAPQEAVNQYREKVQELWENGAEEGISVDAIILK